ncbi:hypothetical protein EN794_001950 [Mesorhizobium sp. M00.F.Ca.ET.151.01.1.1]|nr:hypothetical protein EN794_001950 [Mesorhizobium sp. M00.F.Ca.ET.151.01.1.1]TGV52866.1 hypothetical protein EN784_42125 [bacterium M00.F.Ca.ET.141.01.1.1]
MGRSAPIGVFLDGRAVLGPAFAGCVVGVDRAVRHLKDAWYLASENCTHIAQNWKMTILCFIFNKLK